MNIEITAKALRDLENIEQYIKFKLHNFTAATETINGIINVIYKLRTFPREHAQLYYKKTLTDIGKPTIHLSYYKNFNIIYTYDNHLKTISILRILYVRADWQNRINDY